MVLLNQQPQSEDGDNRPGIVVRFTEPGSALFDIKFTDGITPTMLLALSGYLETTAKADLMEMREMAKVQTARLNPDLGQLGR